MSAAKDIAENYQHVIDELSLVMGDKGVFDVVVDDTLVYSKAETGRHVNEGEVLSLFADHVGPDVSVYPR